MLAHVLKCVKSYLITDNQTIKAAMVKGFSGNLLLKTYYAVATFLTSILLARLLGVGEFGLYYYALSWVLILGIFAKLGLGIVITKNVAAYNVRAEFRKIKGIFTFSVAAIFVVSMFLSLAAIFLTLNISVDEHKSTVLYWAFLLLPLQALLVPVNSIQSGFQHVFHAQLPSFFVQPTVFIVLLTTLWVLNIEITARTAILVLLLTTLVGLLVGLFFLKRHLPQPFFLADAEYDSRAWIKSGFALVLAGSMVTVNANADIAMLGIFSSMDAAGIYKAAARGSELVYFVLSSIAVPLSPLIAKLYAQNDRAKLQKLVTTSARIGFIAGVLVAVPLMLMSQWFLGLFGAGFVIGSAALQVLCLGQLANVFSGPADYLLMMSGHEKQVAFVMSGAAGLNVILNVILIPVWGIEGAAIATALSTAIMRLGLWYLSTRYLEVNSTGF